jgi:hypothetical protein
MCPISALVSPGTRHRGFGSIDRHHKHNACGKGLAELPFGTRLYEERSAEIPTKVRMGFGSAVAMFSQVPENNASSGRTRTDPEITLVATIVSISLNDTEKNLYRGA